jgi:hypothetical protein
MGWNNYQELDAHAVPRLPSSPFPVLKNKYRWLAALIPITAFGIYEGTARWSKSKESGFLSSVHTQSTTTIPKGDTWETDVVEYPMILSSLTTCGCGCGKTIDRHQGYYVAAGKVWAKEHYVCADCHHALQGKMQTDSRRKKGDRQAKGNEEESWVFYRDGKLYCVHDYMARFCVYCHQCGNKLGDQLALDPKWGVASCPQCFVKTGGAYMAKVDEPVMTDKEGEELLTSVREWLSSRMGLELKTSEGKECLIPLLMVDREEMSRLRRSKNISLLRKLFMQSTSSQEEDALGLTLKVTTTSSQSKCSSSTTSTAATYYIPQKVALLRGLSHTHAGAVLAHELMHCWITLHIAPHGDLPTDVEEGLCELMAYFWLCEHQQQQNNNVKIGLGRTTYQQKMGREDVHTPDETVHLIQSMEDNMEPKQGLSFHKAFHALQGRSLKELLNYVKEEHRYPL